MKKITMLMILTFLGLAIACPQAVSAEPSATVKGIFEALLSEDSVYSQNKAYYLEYFPETSYEETLNDDGFTITVSGNEYSSGSWTFREEGDYLTLTAAEEDFSAAMLITNVLEAVGVQLGMDPGLLRGYVNGLTTLEIENDSFILESNEADKTSTYKINIAGPYEMKELDRMVIDRTSFDHEPLTDEYLSMAAYIGKLKVIANGNADGLTVLLAEYGETDELAYQSLINIAEILQPKGWEQFKAEYKELADAEGDGYSVKLDPDAETIAEIIEDARTEDSFVLVRFGEQASR